MENYYEILEVSPDASFQTIKSAYRRLAILLHPDKNTAPDATEAFQRLGRAWETLKSTEKRNTYDTLLAAERRRSQPSEARATPAAPKRDYGTATEEDAFLDDMLSSVWYQERYGVPPRSAGPSKDLQDESEIAAAENELRSLNDDYEKRLINVIERVRKEYSNRGLWMSEGQLRAAAEAELNMKSLRMRINALKESIRKGFEQRLRECNEAQKGTRTEGF
ncbi:hypothetical protein M430DRAFT_15959 [Amorphotheca resinae ATCC 22711]|jgi:curved DNA-binding protein CbpA|uniref:J domain-containing protein n=1 Tax=Amorphotheca resinae ATCC 22711 TaxID=857342 RepID=A0A2T3BA79_AMORE|nr:hypothetical protein M430DRAFT_15959 [Amorphotheca resinae ATCC 22711]PSS25232.1 hypothetical protein M430DRAFT_15959 [Amorphotheca resinae ATCC 22711]